MTPVTNNFTTYELTPDEDKASKDFTPCQLAMLQNLLVEVMQNKVSLVVDASDMSSYIQQEAEMQGQISILQHLISQVPSNQEAEI